MPVGSLLVSLISIPADGFLASLTSFLMAAPQQIFLVLQQVTSCSPALVYGSSVNCSNHLVGTATSAPVGSESQPGLEFKKVTGIFQVAPSLGTLTSTTVRAALCICYPHSL